MRGILLAKRHRIAIGSVLTVDIALLSMFVWWAIVHRYEIKGSIFYGNMLFSKVDWSLIEIWGYLKEAAIVILSIYIYLRCREIFYVLFAILFMSVLIDDAAGLHEILGGYIYQLTDNKLISGFLAPSITCGIPLFLTVAATFKLNHSRRWPAFILLFGFFVLAFFGVVVDNLEELVFGTTHNVTFAALLEDGGELLSLTALLTGFAFIFERFTLYKAGYSPIATIVGSNVEISGN